MGASPSIQDRFFLQKVKLGEGGFGKVWRAVDKQSGDLVAVKQLDKAVAIRQGLTREMLEREISVMQAVSHENVTQFFGSWEDGTNLFLVLEYCDGGDFGDKVSERGLNLEEAAAAEWMRQILSAIAALHDKRICHRDVKPDNFMVHGSVLKLSDFGLAIYLPKGRLQEKCGTPAFLAPEQHLLPDRSRGYDHACDIWAAGLTMYMLMLGGKHPFMSADGRYLDEQSLLEGNLDFRVGGFLFAIGSEPRYSPEARRLCQRLVCPDASARISAREACQDSWFQPPSSKLSKPCCAEPEIPLPKKDGTTSKARRAELRKKIESLQVQLKMQQEQNETQVEALIENQRLMKELAMDKQAKADEPCTLLPSPLIQVLQAGLKCHHYSSAAWHPSEVQGYNPQACTFHLCSAKHVCPHVAPEHICPAPEASEAEAWPQGTAVVYKSSSSGQWLPAVVKSFNVSVGPGKPGTYNLDVRDHASCERIRPRLPPFA